MIDLDYDGITLKKAIGNSWEIKRLNKNVGMTSFWEMVIKASKKMLASVSLINLTLLTLIRESNTGWGLLKQ